MANKKLKLKINKHLFYLLEIGKTMLDLSDNDINKIMEEFLNCIDITPMLKYDVTLIKITNKKINLKFTVYTQGDILLKTNIVIEVIKKSNNDFDIKVTPTVKILDDLIISEIVDQKVNVEGVPNENKEKE